MERDDFLDVMDHLHTELIWLCDCMKSERYETVSQWLQAFRVDCESVLREGRDGDK